MHILKDICSNLEYQLEDVVKKGDMTPSELDLVYKSVKTMYYIKTIEAMDEYAESEYSRAGRGGSSYGGSYEGGGYSSRRGSYGMESAGYSGRRGRYSRDNEREGVMRELGDMMSRASSDIERQTIAKVMDRVGE